MSRSKDAYLFYVGLLLERARGDTELFDDNSIPIQVGGMRDVEGRVAVSIAITPKVVQEEAIRKTSRFV